MCERRGNMIICGRGSHRSLGKCQECWVREATQLCDGPRSANRPSDRRIAGSDKSCSKPLCRHCATHGAGDTDYCKEHADPEKRRLAL